MKIHFAQEGLPYVFTVGGVTLVLDLLGWWSIGLVGLVMTLLVAAFFRDPERQVPEGENFVVSPADGRVVAVDKDQTLEAVPGERFWRVGVFMSPLDVHVNRVPVTGRVISVRHTPGRFLAAFSDRAASENERNEVVMRDRFDRSLAFVQIAGWLARRIVCRLKPGQPVEQGARCGLILFGSRVDVYLPEVASLRVGLGDRVRAGSDVIGELPS